jgi:hypothetical protein
MNSGFSTYPGPLLPGRRKAAKLKLKLQLGELDGRLHMPVLSACARHGTDREPRSAGSNPPSMSCTRSNPRAGCSRPTLLARPRNDHRNPSATAPAYFQPRSSCCHLPCLRFRPKVSPTGGSANHTDTRAHALALALARTWSDMDTHARLSITMHLQSLTHAGAYARTAVPIAPMRGVAACYLVLRCIAYNAGYMEYAACCVLSVAAWSYPLCCNRTRCRLHGACCMMRIATASAAGCIARVA